jgi:DNA-binding HxlR family transcriptional regulator/putative sterol carrier protein
MSIAKRSYHQYCALASALDVLGERWTLLIIRELLIGPRRYGELLAGLPGLGTNLLADRLKSLVDLGVLCQVDLKGTGTRLAYQLTPKGEELRPVVLSLARWGMDYVGEPAPDDTVRPHWGFLAVQSMIDETRVGTESEQYEFRVDGEVFHIAVGDGRAEAVRGPAPDAVMTAMTDAATFVQIGSGTLTPLMAMVAGKLALEGDMAAVTRCCELIGLTTGAPTDGALARAGR